MTRRLSLALALLVTLNLAGCALAPLLMDKNVGYGATYPAGTPHDQTMPNKR